MERGDIYHVDLDPIRGREQAGRRYVMIVSPRAFNRLGTPLVCPITLGGGFSRAAGFAVSLHGLGLQADGVVLCNQLRTIDMDQRGGRFLERAPADVVDEVLAKVRTLLD